MSNTVILVHIGPEHRTTRFFSDAAAAAAPDGALAIAPEGFDSV